MTQTEAPKDLIMQKSNIYDLANSLLVLTVYFKYTWKDQHNKPCNSIPYYLKFIKDTGYDGYNTEFPRAFERLTEIQDSNNPFKTALLYQNHNKGRMLRGVENPQIFKIVDSKGTLMLTIASDMSDNVTEFINLNFEELRNKYHGKI